MQKVRVNLENCYGIHKFEHEFDFTPNGSATNNVSAYSIYAPNGFMKTSLAKTFDDISKEQQSQDRIYPDRVTLREVTDETGSPISPNNVFVIEPYNQDFNSEKTSLLLVNQEIKKKYDDALKGITEKHDALIKKLKQLSGLNGRSVSPESEITRCFSSNSVLDLLDSLDDRVNAEPADRLAMITYSEMFNERTIALLDSGEIKSQLAEYIEKYNELVNKSPILSKGFSHYHASVVQKSLADNGFFSASHSLNLKNGGTEERIESADELAKKIEAEKQNILADEDLAKKFDAIDKKIANADLRKFRDYLFDNQDILVQLQNYQQLQKDIWIAYLRDQKDIFNELIREYRHGKELIKTSIDAARKEKTDWEEVVDIFNKRFSVPFTVKVVNQDEVILKGSAPQISFSFLDPEEEKSVKREELLQVLSQGEKRALYILNILFEINVRKKQGTATLLIVDDIADSFDYKNKYAIVQYLKEISQLGLFYCIFLTHNFDFHRTISGRLSIPRPKKLHAVKNSRDLHLVQETYQKNPFDTWRDNLTKPRYCISAIPFIRNLAEYCGFTAEYNQLTSLLHVKSDTMTLTCSDLQTIYQRILIDKSALVLPNHGKLVIDLIFEITDSIVQEAPAVAELESKITLSIAIRLKAEQYMTKKIADRSFISSITRNQTIELFNRFKSDFPADLNAIELLEQVNLMTPENIHLNSFMYEPILDMDSTHLRELYSLISGLA